MSDSEVEITDFDTIETALENVKARVGKLFDEVLEKDDIIARQHMMLAKNTAMLRRLEQEKEHLEKQLRDQLKIT